MKGGSFKVRVVITTNLIEAYRNNGPIDLENTPIITAETLRVGTPQPGARIGKYAYPTSPVCQRLALILQGIWHETGDKLICEISRPFLPTLGFAATATAAEVQTALERYWVYFQGEITIID